MTDVRAAASGRGEVVAAGLAALSLVLFLLAVTEVLDVGVVYMASLLLGIGAVVTGLRSRRAGGGPMAMVGVVVGGILALMQAGWILLAVLGVIEDTA